MLLTYQIGHEALNGNPSRAGMLRALKKQPSCTTEILIAGITEILETKPAESGAQEAIAILRAAAKQIDAAALRRCAHRP